MQLISRHQLPQRWRPISCKDRIFWALPGRSQKNTPVAPPFRCQSPSESSESTTDPFSELAAAIIASPPPFPASTTSLTVPGHHLASRPSPFTLLIAINTLVAVRCRSLFSI
ncbi:hypothetical protein Moror_6670 [Moniliophthora roreri MCA 2997]|uniref:Uncharacterized protein n=1 Tax=Moniliophthora roreri (strain MCA 2997) TaxID=1381753 RepID=V2XC84_MONRO|nr:hypothetical protein Moror_6670 [Moniliophthora roreri MCA 2997]